jgi:hypothetical protein
MPLRLEKIFLEREDEPCGRILRSESVYGTRRDEDQCVRRDRQIIKIYIEGRRSACHPEYLVKIVPVRTLPIPTKP